MTQPAADEWVSFPGGELEGVRPKVLCGACREALQRGTLHARTLCFGCYRAGLERDRALRAAGELNTASEARFQDSLPFEPVDRPRLAMLKAERADARAALLEGTGRFVDKRRRAQIAARHALQSIAEGLKARGLSPAERDKALAFAARAAELQLPEAWLPFVVSR